MQVLSSISTLLTLTITLEENGCVFGERSTTILPHNISGRTLKPICKGMTRSPKLAKRCNGLTGRYVHEYALSGASGILKSKPPNSMPQLLLPSFNLFINFLVLLSSASVGLCASSILFSSCFLAPKSSRSNISFIGRSFNDPSFL